MSERIAATLDNPERLSLADKPRTASSPAPRVSLTVHQNFASIEAEWRAFEKVADGTVFQTFDWLSTWQRHIGTLTGVRPAIVIGRDEHGTILFLLPLMVEPGLARRLTFLGSEICDYNGPLLAPDFYSRVGDDQFPALWRDIRAMVQRSPELRHDFIHLSRMPEHVGGQTNPFLQLPVALNPSGAYVASLPGGNWDAFYTQRRSTSTRKRDRTKLQKLGDFGEVRLVQPKDADDAVSTLEQLMIQKARSFARMGVANLFDRPGHRAFFRDLASRPSSIVHVSRLEVGSLWAAANLGLVHRDSYYHVLSSYDDGDVSKFGPGAAHLRELMRYAIEHGLTRFDFTVGDEPYKREWSDITVALYDHMNAATLRGQPIVAATDALRRLKRTIKQTPALWRAYSRLRAIFGGKPRSSLAPERVEKSPPVAPT